MNGLIFRRFVLYLGRHEELVAAVELARLKGYNDSDGAALRICKNPHFNIKSSYRSPIILPSEACHGGKGAVHFHYRRPDIGST